MFSLEGGFGFDDYVEYNWWQSDGNMYCAGELKGKMPKSRKEARTKCSTVKILNLPKIPEQLSTCLQDSLRHFETKIVGLLS